MAIEDVAKEDLNKAEAYVALHWKSFWGGIVIGAFAGWVIGKVL